MVVKVLKSNQGRKQELSIVLFDILGRSGGVDGIPLKIIVLTSKGEGGILPPLYPTLSLTTKK